MTPVIMAATETHFEGWHKLIGNVAREKTFLASIESLPTEQALAFFKNLLAKGFPQYLAVQDNEVIGWCDVAPVFAGSRAHIGVLGMGLAPEFRHHGLGARLLEVTLEHSWRIGLSRVELTVRVDNTNARRLYERHGFQAEGLHRHASLIDGVYHDIVPMAILKASA